MAYCTASDLLDYGNFSTDTATDDATLIACCTWAENIVNRYTGRSFQATSDIRYFDAINDIDGDTLWLDEDLAFVDCDTIIVNGDGSTDLLWTSDNLYWVTEPRNRTPHYAIKLTDNGGKDWTYDSNPEMAISVDGYWGYSTNVPADVKWATIRLATWIYKQRQTDVDLDRPLLTNDGMTIMPTKIPADVASILELYKKLL